MIGGFSGPIGSGRLGSSVALLAIGQSLETLLQVGDKIPQSLGI